MFFKSWHIPTPGGESLEDMRDRAKEFFQVYRLSPLLYSPLLINETAIIRFPENIRFCSAISKSSYSSSKRMDLRDLWRWFPPTAASCASSASTSSRRRGPGCGRASRTR